MSATGAVVFLPREGTGPSRMLEELLFDPAALWLTEALESAGVEQFFVVCHSDDREKAQACFPEGTEFVTGSTGDALEQLMDFLARLEGKVLVFTRLSNRTLEERRRNYRGDLKPLQPPVPLLPLWF